MTTFERYKQLRDKVNSQTASLDELIEFTRLYRSGQFKEEEEEDLKRIWSESTGSYNEDWQTHERIRSAIIPNSRKIHWLHPQRWVWPAAAAVMLLGVLGLWSVNQTQDDTPVAEGRTFMFSGPAYITLPDGSTVELDHGSSMSYNNGRFNKDRDIHLLGTAFFDVVHEVSRPFKVHSGRLVTTVLGTSFNVRDKKNGHIEVTVIHGKVAVGDRAQTFQTILPNEKIIVATNTMTYTTMPTNAEDEIRWKKDNIIFDQITMEEAARLLEKKFDVTIQFQNPKVKNCPIKGWFHKGVPLHEILDQISAVHEASIVIDHNNLIIKGGTGCEIHNKKR